VRGNLVKNFDADESTGNTAVYGIVLGNASPTVTSTFSDVSNNRVIDDQVHYSTGTVCSVSGPTSTTCLTSGSSRWLYSSGATWSQAWPNRYIFIASTPYQIRAFYSANYIELETAVPVFSSSGVAYSLTWTIANGYYLGANIVNFTNNYGYVMSPSAGAGYMTGYPNSGWICDVSGDTIQNLANNTFISPRQSVVNPSCANNYNYYNQSPTPVGGVSCANSAGTLMVSCASSATALYTMPNIATSDIGGVLFRYDASIACTSATTSATAILTLGYTDVSGTAQTVTAGTATCTTLGSASIVSLSGTFMMYGSSSVTYNVTTANSPQYQARVMIYQETTQ